MTKAARQSIKSSIITRPIDLKPQDVTLFWSKVSIGAPDICWPFRGPKSGAGYGRFRNFPAHRLAWSLENGSIPSGLLICHQCDNPPCCNPKHLFVGSSRDNVRDMMQKGRHRFGGPKGEKHGRAKLHEDDIRGIRAVTGQESCEVTARRYGVSRQQVKRIQRRLGWTHVQ